MNKKTISCMLKIEDDCILVIKFHKYFSYTLNPVHWDFIDMIYKCVFILPSAKTSVEQPI